MSAQNDGGLAFPYEEHNSDGTLHRDHYGISARDYFAGKALQGICASGPGRHMGNDLLAAESYAIADAMLAERAKGGAQ